MQRAAGLSATAPFLLFSQQCGILLKDARNAAQHTAKSEAFANEHP
jgi:hypothetical protein